MNPLRDRLNATAQSLTALSAQKSAGAAAWERDMGPVRDAIVEALQQGDVQALRGLRAMLPTLLKDVSRKPALADYLAWQMGKAFLDGMQAGNKGGAA